MIRVSLWLCTAWLVAASALAQKIEPVAGGGTEEANAPATQCRLREPFAVEFLPSGEMIIVEMVSGNRVLKVDAAGKLTVVAGTGAKGYSGDGGPALAATFNGLHNLAITPSGELLLADSFNHVLRRMTPDGALLQTVSGQGQKGLAGDGGPAAGGRYSTLIQIALDSPRQRLLLADIGNRRIRQWDMRADRLSTVAGNGQAGVPADGAVAAEAPLVDPRAVVPDTQGGFYILERNGHALRYVDPAGKIRTVAGTGAKGSSGDGGPALQATFNGPKHLCLDRDGTVLIADAENHVIRRYDPKSGLLIRVAGTGQAGASGLGGDPLRCGLRRPHGVTIGPDGTLYITDSYNDRILRITK